MLALVVAVCFGVPFFSSGGDHAVMPFLALALLAAWAPLWTRLGTRLPKREALLKLLAWVTLEELALSAWWWNASMTGYPLVPGVPQEALLGPLAFCLLVLAVVWSRVRLPEWAFPLKGRWLRGALAAVALAGIVALGPWGFAAWTFWQTDLLHRVGAVALLLDVLLYSVSLWHSVSGMGERKPVPLRAA